MKSLWSKMALQLKEIIKHFGWSILLLIPVFIVTNWSFFATINTQEDSLVTSGMNEALQDMEMIDYFISRSIASTHDDLHIILDSDEASDFRNDNSDENLQAFKDLAYRIATNKSEFLEISLADNNGDQLFELSRDGETIYFTDQEDLVNISGQDYYDLDIDYSQRFLYLQGLYKEDEKTVLTMITPILIEDNFEYLFVLKYDANYFLTVFNQYLNDSNKHYTVGLINYDSIWKIDEENFMFYELNNQSEIDSLLNDIENSDYAQSLNIDIGEDVIHLVNVDDDFFKLYAIFDSESAIEESSLNLLKYPWLNIIFNILLLAFFIYMGYLIKNKNSDRILLNANRYLSEKNQDGVIITDENKRIQYVNKAFRKFFGYESTVLLNKTPESVIGVRSFDLVDLNYDSETIFEKNTWNLTNDNLYLLKYLRIRCERTPRGRIKHYLGIYSKAEIDFENFIRSTTAKNKLIKILSDVFIEKIFIKFETCLMMIKFQKNSIMDLALFLRSRLDDRFLLAIPKDNYLLIYANINRYQLNQTVDMMDEFIEKYKQLQYSKINFNHQLVIALSEDRNDTLESLLDSLLTVLKVSDDNKQLKHHIYKAEMDDLLQRQNEIFDQLSSAFITDEFYLNYQVQVNLSDQNYSGVEALLRWDNKKLGNIPPNEFIPIIEKSFYINQLTIMVIKKIVKDFTPYVSHLPNNFRISLNLTHFDFTNSYIMDQILNIIDESVIPSRFFNFEITESNYIDSIDKVNKTIDILHKKDICIAIDDFGTGFSSINSIKLINVDQVKIDKSFIQRYPDKDNGEMFRKIAQLINSLNKEIVVEGTETLEQIKFSKENNCHIAQGYYISRPIDINAFIDQFIINQDSKKGEKL